MIWFIWSVWFNQTNETDQINKRDQPILVLHAPRSLALTDFFSILLERLGGIIEMGQRVAKGTTH
ncbi:MAG: hypothetical protein ABIQ24_08545 [Nitrospiraceae bacterium]